MCVTRLSVQHHQRVAVDTNNSSVGGMVLSFAISVQAQKNSQVLYKTEITGNKLYRIQVLHSYYPTQRTVALEEQWHTSHTSLHIEIHSAYDMKKIKQKENNKYHIDRLIQ